MTIPSVVDTASTEQSPHWASRWLLYIVVALFCIAFAWSWFGHLDVVAVAPGKLVPQSFIKIMQPADAGIVREILVKEGDRVTAGQVLMRMDARIADAERKVVENDLRLRVLQVRRIEAELSGVPMQTRPDDDRALFGHVEAQFRARREGQRDAEATEEAVLLKTRHDLAAAVEIEKKLQKMAPIFRDQAEGWDRLAKEGYAGRLMALEKQRQYIENQQDLSAHQHVMEGLRATIAQSEKRLAQIRSGYRTQLQGERLEAGIAVHRLQQESDKQDHRSGLLELRAAVSGTVKDLATHTTGTVVAPGTVLLTIVPQGEPLQAEVWISNADIGFITPGREAKLKIATFPYHQYGMLSGKIRHVSADASDRNAAELGRPPGAAAGPLYYRTLVELNEQTLSGLSLAAGLQVSAEVHLAQRRVVDYLLSPVQRVVHEAARER